MITEQFRHAARRAAELDAQDPLASCRDLFVDAGDAGVRAYLDGNSLGRPLVRTAERLLSFVHDAWGDRLIRSWPERWMDEPTAIGDRLGTAVLGAAAGQVVVADSTSVLLYKLIRAAVDGAGGRNEIVVDRENFPTDRFVIEGVAAERGLVVRWLDVDRRAGVTTADLAPVLGDRTALVVLGHVAFRSGFIADADAITRQVHRAGALVLWDLCHSAGAVPVRLDDWQADLAVGCTYKYLNGGPGSPAFAYVATRWQDRLVQPIWGWMGSAAPFDMPAAYARAPGVRQILSGTPTVLAMQPMRDMIELIETTGMESIRQKAVALTEFAIELVDEHLGGHGVTLASPRDHRLRGAHVTIEHPAFEHVTQVLWQRGVMPDYRPPDGIRIGLSPLSTSFREVCIGVQEIERALPDGP